MSRHVEFFIQGQGGGSSRSVAGLSYGSGSPAGAFGRLGVPVAMTKAGDGRSVVVLQVEGETPNSAPVSAAKPLPLVSNTLAAMSANRPPV